MTVKQERLWKQMMCQSFDTSDLAARLDDLEDWRPSWTYRQTVSGWETGHYDRDGRWAHDGWHGDMETAAARVRELSKWRAGA